MADVVTIAGAPSSTSRASRLLTHIQGILEQQGFSVSPISVTDLPAEDLVKGNFQSPQLQQITQRVEACRGVIISTPVYKASYTGVLKALLDLLPQYAFAGKTILPIAVGGTLNHLLAIDFSMKPLFTIMGATSVLRGVYIVSSQIQSDDAGQIRLDDEIASRLQDALTELVREVEPV